MMSLEQSDVMGTMPVVSLQQNDVTGTQCMVTSLEECEVVSCCQKGMHFAGCW